jgi:putative redox protein
MVEITIAYEGNLHCRAMHGPSGTGLETDAPKDNMGLGESFSPTDLVATALGTCMLTVMGIAARKLKVDMAGATANVKKEMVATPMRRIGALTVVITVPGNFTDEQKQVLEDAAMHCPVHHSLHPDVKVTVAFSWS